MRKAVGGSYYMPKQARELQTWVDGKKLEDKLYRELEEKQEKKDSAEIFMDTIGQAFMALAGIAFVIMIVAQVLIRLGWL